MSRFFVRITPDVPMLARSLTNSLKAIQFYKFGDSQYHTGWSCPKVHTLFFTRCGPAFINSMLYPPDQFPSVKRVYTDADEAHDIELAAARFHELKDLPPHDKGFTAKELEPIIGAGNIQRFMKFMTGQTCGEEKGRGTYYYPRDVLTFIRLQTRQPLYRHFKDDGVPIR